MKKVLIALDNNNNYHLVSNKGYELASALGAKVVLLHVFPDTITTSLDSFSGLYPTVGPLNLEADLQLAEKLKAASEEFLNEVKSELNDDTAEIYTSEGDAGKAILEIADSCKADVIVLGSHSRSRADTILMGDVTKQVLRHSHLPLFIIPVK
jgi:nucleotide-binding universal stress UspA family protein